MPNDLPDRMVSARARLGLTQAEAAERAGISSRAWGSYERGAAEPKPSTRSLIERLISPGNARPMISAHDGAEPARPASRPTGAFLVGVGLDGHAVVAWDMNTAAWVQVGEYPVVEGSFSSAFAPA